MFGNPSFNIEDDVKASEYNSTKKQRDWWNKASKKAKESLLKGKLNFTDVYSLSETATEASYQRASFDEILNKKYDSLPLSVKETITEGLIGIGELPDPKVYEGIGQKFTIEGDEEDYIECDRCDTVFQDEEDFDLHKEIDHGDEPEDYDEAEEAYTYTFNPEINREALKQARRIITETDQGDLYRDLYFKANTYKPETKGIPQKKGKQGYDDNPNEGLYDHKLFKKGQRYSSGFESYAKEMYTEFDLEDARNDPHEFNHILYNIQEDAKRMKWGNYSIGEEPETLEYYEELLNTYDYMPEGESYAKENLKEWVEDLGPFELVGIIGKYKEIDELDISDWEKLSLEYGLSLKEKLNESYAKEFKPELQGKKVKIISGNHQGETGEIQSVSIFGDDFMVNVNGKEIPLTENDVEFIGEVYANELDHYEQKDHFTPDDWQKTLEDLKQEYEGAETDDYPEHNIPALENINVSLNKIDYVYPTKATEADERSYDYEEKLEDDIEQIYDYDEETDDEAVENLIIHRKLNGYTDYNVAQELYLRLGIPHEEALQKSYSIEVSTNDRVAHTYFGKMYSQCTEAEKDELRLYSGE